jgi:hypothetical protein
VARLRDTSYLYEEEKKWAKAALPYVERQKKREELAAHLAAQADKRKAFAEKKSRERLATWLTAKGLIAERVGPRPLSPWEIAETRAIAGHSPYPAEILPHRPAPCPQTAQDWFALSQEDKEIYLDRALEEDDGQILFYLDNIMFPFVERTLSGERLDQAIQIVFPEAQTRTLDIGVLVREWREHHITDLEDLALMIGVSLQLTPEELIDYLAGDLSPLAEFAPLVQRAASQ